MEEEIRVITDLNKICRTCLSERNRENLKSLFESSLDVTLFDLTAVKV